MSLLELLLSRLGRRRDRGFGMVSTIVGIALGAIIVGGMAALYFTANQSQAKSAALEASNTSITQTIDRVSQNVQVASTILVAAPNQLVTASTDPTTKERVYTRWVRENTALYQSIWRSAPADYPYGNDTAWPATSQTGDRPGPGGGTQSVRTSVRDVSADVTAVFAYFDRDGKPISASPALSAKAGTTTAIRRIDVHLKTDLLANGNAEHQTAIAVRNATGGVSDGAAAAAVCPQSALDAHSTGAPALRWNTVSGSTTYLIYRNSGLVATVTTDPSAQVGAWKDTNLQTTAGQAVAYTVIAKYPNGAKSAGCRPVIWRAEIVAPDWTTATVTTGPPSVKDPNVPGSKDTTGWESTALTAPRINLGWNAVDGASGYQVFYREVDFSSGTPLGTGNFTAAPGYTTGTSYQWDGGGYGHRYEWYIRATARSGESADSLHVHTATHPATPTNVRVSAQYGTGATRNTTGQNVLTWDAVPTASSYRIWRYTSGVSGSVDVLSTTASTTFTDAAAGYGSTFSYYVTAINAGPRGLLPGSTSTDTSNRSSANPEATAVPAASVVTQLQYPPIPAITPVSAGGSQDNADRSNTVRWSAAASATGYTVQRLTPTTKVPTCLTGTCAASGGTTALSYVEKTVPAGSQRDYRVKAYNRTGPSVDYSSSARITQRPATPSLVLQTAPSLTDDRAAMAITANGDTGNDSSNSFCTNASCAYELRTTTKSIGQQYQATGSKVTWSGVLSAQGQTTGYTARSQNDAITNGGWSDTDSVDVNTYPGTPSVVVHRGDVNNHASRRMNLTWQNVDGTPQDTTQQTKQYGYTTVTWSGATGAASVTARRSVPANNEAISTDTTEYLPATHDLSTTKTGETGYADDVAAPGIVYHYDLTVTGQNGLKRPVTGGDIATPADFPRHGEVIVVCSGTRTQTDPKVDDPNQLTGGGLQNWDNQPQYGVRNGSTVLGIANTKTSSTPVPNNREQSQGTSPGIWRNQGGTAYFYGNSNGFRIAGKGSGSIPDSMSVDFYTTQLAQYPDCNPAPQGATWFNMVEPAMACYGYVPGMTCDNLNPDQRPMWYTGKDPRK
ncbi:hypothetical protein V6N00_13410 [Tersicoccus sp. MR15.9]|uniref:hypothetical protein n=1 Tax=Tersicoccus mangrovi TaxID=3121635 RepID=UPI002FE5F9EC